MTTNRGRGLSAARTTPCEILCDTFLLITFDRIMIATWGRCQNVPLVQTHRMICNITYLSSRQATTWPGLGKKFQRWRGLSLGGPRGKGSPSVSMGPKLFVQLLQLLKNSPREVKRAHFRYILGPPPRSHPGDGVNGARRGRPLPVHPGFSSHALDLDLRSNFEVDLPRISPASASDSPFPMWFDACPLLQNHP